MVINMKANIKTKNFMEKEYSLIELWSLNMMENLRMDKDMGKGVNIMKKKMFFIKENSKIIKNMEKEY